MVSMENKRCVVNVSAIDASGELLLKHYLEVVVQKLLLQLHSKILRGIHGNLNIQKEYIWQYNLM